MENEFGQIEINLEHLLKERKMSKSQLSYKAQISRTQINKFCKKEVTRFDVATLSRLCTVLDCTLAELLIFIPAESKITPP